MNEEELEALVVRAAKEHGSLLVVRAHLEAAEREQCATLYGILDAASATLSLLHEWQEDMPTDEWTELVDAIEAAFKDGDVLSSMGALEEQAREAGDREEWLVLTTVYRAISEGLVGPCQMRENWARVAQNNRRR